MRRQVLVLAALGALAAGPAAASFTGSLYYTNFADHHVRRLEIASNVAGGTSDLGGLPGADGIIYDPLDNNQLLIGGQNQNNLYRLGTNGGAFSTVNNAPIVGGSLHLAVQNPVVTAPGADVPVSPNILTTGYEGGHTNALAIVNEGSGNVDNRLITGTATGFAAGIAVRDLFIPVSPGNQATGVPPQTIYLADGPEAGTGGHLYTVNLGTNVATAVNVQANGNDTSHDLHGLWLDKKTGHLFGTGAKRLEEIDLDAIGGPKLVRSWDLSAFIPESSANEGHTDQCASDDFGNMFVASNSGEIIYIDLNAGSPTPTLIKKVADVNLDDLVVGPSAVPEPSTLVLAGLGLVGLAVLKKRA